MAHADREVRLLEDIAKEARHHGDERDRSKGYLQAHSICSSPAPNGLELTGDGGAAAGVRCSAVLGTLSHRGTLATISISSGALPGSFDT